MNARALRLLSLTLFLSVSSGFAQDVITAEFELIPFALGANDLTPDGRYLVGEADWNGDGFPDGSYRWDSVTNTYTDLELTGDPTTTVPAVSISDDGSIVLGNIPDPNDPNAGGLGNVAGIWRESTGQWESLGYLPNAGTCPSRSAGYELSADGSIAVGLSWDGCSGRAFRWTQPTGMIEMDVLANASCRASVVSADGTLSAGFCQGSFSRTPAIWDAAGNGQLLDPPNGDALGEIHGMNDAGDIMLGNWLDPNGTTGMATMWTPGTGPAGWDRAQIGAGSLLPGWGGIPQDIDDCGVIVGFDFLIGNRRAWIIDDDGNYQLLKDFVTNHGGTVPDGFPMEVASAISTDGTTIVGHGFGTGAWRVTITRTPLCPGDASRDGEVDLTDLAQLLADFGNSGCRLPADVNGDGTIDLTDLAIVLANFGNSCT